MSKSSINLSTNVPLNMYLLINGVVGFTIFYKNTFLCRKSYGISVNPVKNKGDPTGYRIQGINVYLQYKNIPTKKKQVKVSELMALLIDLLPAFDYVNHALLSQKLNELGC